MARIRRRSLLLSFSILQHCFLILLLLGTTRKANATTTSSSSSMTNMTTLTVRALAAESGGENADVTKNEEEECTEADKCQMCTYSDQKSIPACKETGRMQKFTCSVLSDEGEVQEQRTEIRSCKKTEADEEFGMIRLQMLCLVIGSLAFVTVRKQKRAGASLFDQRKQQAQAQQQTRGRRDSNFVSDNDDQDEEQIEFTPMTNQETVPLVLDTTTTISNNPLEVI